jgi:outer membrane protein TolC
MKFLCAVLLCGYALSAAGEQLFPAADALLPPSHHSAETGPVYTLEQIEQMALASNPEIRVATRRLAVVQAHVPVAGALDDPFLMYRGWGVPLSRPWDYNAAQNMFMVSQTFPGSGKRGLRADLARSDAEEARAELESTRLDVRVRVRKAFYDLLRAEDGLRIHDQHLGIARQAVEAARIKYTVGRVPQQDILKAQVELTRLAEHLIHFEQDAEIARVHLNTLLGHDPAAAISVSGDYVIPQQLPGTEALEKTAQASRPDLAQAQAGLEKSRQQRQLSKKNYSPDFTLSGGYMLAPAGSTYRNNYMIEGAINLPWLNRRRHDAEISEAEAEVSEQEAELAASRNAAFGQVQEALAQVRTAKKLADLYKSLLQPQAQAALRSTVIAYENDHTDFLNLVDSQTTVVDTDLAYFQAMADFEARFSDLEMAVGTPLDRSGQGKTPEVTQ